MKVFIHSGTQEIEFKRLLDFAICYARQNNHSEVTYQGYITNTSVSENFPKNFKAIPFMEKETFEVSISTADILICHAGTGAIFNSIKLGHRPYVLPRLAKFKEHNDNHQLELFDILKNENLISSLPGDFILETSRDVECKISASRLFNGELTSVLIDEIVKLINPQVRSYFLR